MLCRNIKTIITVLFFAVLLLPAAGATTVLVNSDDWIDVYSGMQFAFLQGYNAKFLTTKRYATILPLIIPKNDDILIIESHKVPFTVNLAATMKRRGYSAETIYASGGRATNIALAKKLDTRKYVIVDPSYGYNAISIIPYAQLTGSYVLFADNRNIGQVFDFLYAQQPESLMLYGHLDEGIISKLSVFNPEIINRGNKYKNNIEILKKHIAIEPNLQLVLTDGSIIEQELMNAGNNREAILLIGRDSVPDVTVDFVKNGNFKSAVLVGNHLSRSGKYLKDSTGLPVFIKFGQGITRGTEAEPVKALDMFFLPVVNLELVFRKAQYNTLTKTVEVIFDNRGVRAFAQTSAGILVNGNRIMTVGDKDIQRIEANKTLSLSYPADLTEYIEGDRALSVDLITLYGEDTEVLDHAVVLTAPLAIVKAKDNCELSVKSVQYDKSTQRFRVKVENDGPVGCYADISLVDVIVDDLPKTIEHPETVFVEMRDSETVLVKQRMTDVDIADNAKVRVKAKYGEREGVLVSLLDVQVPLKEYTGSIINTTVLLIIIIAVLVIIIVVMYLLLRKRGKK